MNFVLFIGKRDGSQRNSFYHCHFGIEHISGGAKRLRPKESKLYHRFYLKDYTMKNTSLNPLDFFMSDLRRNLRKKVNTKASAYLFVRFWPDFNW